MYDNNGNILKQRQFAFTLKDSTLIEELDSTDKAYIYEGDTLVSYDGQSCTYDIYHNPTTYRGKTATWRKIRQLTSFNGHAFTYDGQGRRWSKDNIEYAYDADNRLIKQSDGLEFIYDHTGVAGVIYNSATYLYRKDALGNIIALIDSSGNVVARYVYDAWGNHKVINANGVEITDASNIANRNPFRYRSYYYDRETNLYYLKSRYYDPEVGRFITIDDVAYLDPSAINGLNLYAYCRNNPVMRVDPNGKLSFLIWLSKLWGGSLFGYELRTSMGWDDSPEISTNLFGRIGFSSYTTHVAGNSGLLYAFAGSTTDIMNLFGVEYYAGLGINLFDFVGAEVQLKTLGVGAKVSIGNLSLGFDINLLGNTSITIGTDTDIGNGMTQTTGFTIGVNTGLLVTAFLWIYKFLMTGDASPIVAY